MADSLDHEAMIRRAREALMLARRRARFHPLESLDATVRAGRLAASAALGDDVAADDGDDLGGTVIGRAVARFGEEFGPAAASERRVIEARRPTVVSDVSVEEAEHHLERTAGTVRHAERIVEAMRVQDAERRAVPRDARATSVDALGRRGQTKDHPDPAHTASSDALVDSWLNLQQILTDRAPRTAARIRPPAPDDVRMPRLAALGLGHQPILDAWFSCHDGNDGGDQPLPGLRMLGHDECVDRTMMQRWAWDHHPPLGEGPAGTVTVTWLDDYVMLAASDGSGLACDLRPGDLHGLAFAWDRVDSDTALAVPQRSLSDYLDEVAESIVRTAPFSIFVPQITDGLLTWPMSH